MTNDSRPKIIICHVKSNSCISRCYFQNEERGSVITRGSTVRRVNCSDCDSSQTAVTAYLNQAFYTIRAGGRTGEFPAGETNRSQTATDVVMVIT